jgi:hypothetical protein
MSGSYSSPPCYAPEVAPDYFGVVPAMTCSELLLLLRRLAAAERADASAAATFMNDHELDSAVRKQFAALQRCGLKNCATLTQLIGRLGDNDGRPSEDVMDNAPALQQSRAQIEFLGHGQRRLAGFIHDALPNIEQDFVRHALAEMEDSHLFNIEACEALVETL